MKTRIVNYTFDASEKTIEFDDYVSITLDAILIIANVTDGVIIYNFADADKGGTVLTNVLTLEYNTTTMDDSDDLLIYYDDSTESQAINDGGNTITVDGTVAITSADLGSCKTALELIDDAIIADDAVFTPATTKVMMAGFEADETSTDSVDEGDGGAARMTLDRKVIVTVQPHTKGGWAVMNATSGDGHTALTNSAQVIKASAGQFGGYYIYNPNAAAIYVHVYNVAAASVTVGTTTALLNFCIPAGSAANLEIMGGIPFDTAMSWSATTTGGGNTAPTTALEAMCWYL